jgi:hypothetical protein
MLNPETVYPKRIEDIDRLLERLKKIELILSLVKLGLISGAVYFLFRVALHYSRFALIAFFSFLGVFVLAALVHERFIKKRNFHKTLREINRDEQKALKGDFLECSDGREFEDDDHAYISDLGIFGPRSLFHFLNRTTTSLGKKTLSDWLTYFPDPQGMEPLEKKHEAVKDLSERIDFRQNVLAHGRGIED